MHAASTLVLISCDLSRNFCTCVPHGCQELCTCIVSCSVLTAMQAGGEPFTVACSQEVQGALTGAAELASTSSQEDASEHEAAAAGGSQQGKGMAQSKGRAEASLADAAQHRKRRLKELMAEQELALNLGSATGTRCSSVKGEACSASCEGLSECEIAGRAQHQADDMGPCKHA